MADEPVTIFMATCPFRKNGTPVLGNMGSGIRRVVVIDSDNWSRLMKEVPALAAVQFRVGDLDG